MSKISFAGVVIGLCFIVFSSCCSKQKKQSSGFYALGLLDVSKEYITTDSSYRHEHYYISRYVFLNENDSMFLVVSDKKTDSLFSITCKESVRRLFKGYTSLSVNDLKYNSFDDNRPCCLYPVAVYVKNDTLQSPGLVSGCAIDTRGLGMILHPDNRKFISDHPAFDILEKRYMMEGIIQTANFRSKHPLMVLPVMKLPLRLN